MLVNNCSVIYEVLGLGWIYAVTELLVIGGLVDALYEAWARDGSAAPDAQI